jgi:hypothetical protein
MAYQRLEFDLQQGRPLYIWMYTLELCIPIYLASIEMMIILERFFIRATLLEGLKSEIEHLCIKN